MRYTWDFGLWVGGEKGNKTATGRCDGPVKPHSRAQRGSEDPSLLSGERRRVATNKKEEEQRSRITGGPFENKLI